MNRDKLLVEVKKHLENAVHGEPINKNNRDENGIRHHPDTKYIFSEVEEALRIIEKI